MKRHMYGTRRAVEGWQDECSSALVSAGFVQGRASACVFMHPSRGIAVSVHGDDFTVSGPEEELTWLADTLRSRWDVKASILGPDTHHEQEVKVLNRSIRWTASGIEYEADQRHVHVVLQQLDPKTASRSRPLMALRSKGA